MAKTKTDSTLPAGAKRFSRKGEGFTKLNEGDSVRGIFIGVKEKDVRDVSTGLPKPTRIYSIKVNDKIISLSSRTLLDDCFDDVCASIGGWEQLVGKDVEFSRGEDVETEAFKAGKVDNKMSTYEITIY